jgi:hypothetical protein
MAVFLKDSHLLGSAAVLFSECFLTFRRNIVPSSFGVKQSKKNEEILLGLPDP